MNFSCPSCGVPVKFQSTLSILITCPYCRSTLLRQDTNLELLGTVSELMEDLSPFQVGTQGNYKNNRFHLAGRLKVKWEAGFWSEWYALFDDGREGWLAEAQGNYSMMFESKINPETKKANEFNATGFYKIGDTKWYATDKKEITYSGFEGELPFRFETNYQAISLDLTAERSKIATLLLDERGWSFYEGEYCDFNSFNFDYLKELDGWTRE